MNKKKAQPTTSPAGKSGGSAGKKSSDGPSHVMIADNRKARHHYEILDSLECGMVLVGSEVKSMRNGKCALEEAYGRLKDGELWLFDCEISEYKQASVWNHKSKRPRKLLIHRRELNKFIGKATVKGMTLVPLKMYFNERGLAKCSLGLCRGLRTHDKREVMKTKDAQRDIQRAMRRG